MNFSNWIDFQRNTGVYTGNSDCQVLQRKLGVFLYIKPAKIVISLDKLRQKPCGEERLVQNQSQNQTQHAYKPL